MGKKKVSNILFFITYFLFIFQSMTRWVNIELIIKFSNIIGFLIPFLLIVVFIMKNDNINKKSFFIIYICTCITIISTYITKGNAIWNIVLFVIASKKIDIRKIIKFDLGAKIIIMIFVLLLYKGGFTESIVIYRANAPRYGLGFGHPNTFGVYLLSICLDLIFLTFNNSKKKFSVVFCMVSYVIIATFCDSRSSMNTLIIVTCLTVLFSVWKKNSIVLEFLAKIPWLFLILSFTVTIMYKYANYFPFIYKLNELLSNRILLMYQFFEKYSITIFGNYFIDYRTEATTTAGVLDNAYMLLLIKFGIIVTFLIIWAISKRMKIAVKNKEIGLIICFTGFLFFGLIENGMIVLFYNPFLLFLSDLVYHKRKNKQKNELNE